MAIAVKKVTLWRKEVVNDPGLLADVLEPLSAVGANLRVVMGYAMPGDATRAAIEMYPVTGKRQIAAAKAAGLHESEIACLLVEGDDRAGLGARMARAIARENVNISFVMAETIGRKFSAVFGFQTDSDAANATRAIKSAAKQPTRRR